MVPAIPSAIMMLVESVRGSEMHRQVLYRKFAIPFASAIRKRLV